MADLDIFRDEYVPNAEAVPYHGKWVRANPGEAQQWSMFRDALIQGAQASPPTLATRYGKALVAAGKMALPEAVPEPEPVPPPPPPPALRLSWAPPVVAADAVHWTMTDANRQSSGLLSGNGRDLVVASPYALNGEVMQLNAWRHEVWIGGSIDEQRIRNNYALPFSGTGTHHFEGLLIRCAGDALMSRGGSSGAILQLQNSRVEVRFLGGSYEHSDCFQTQGGTKLKELRLDMVDLVTDYQGLFLRPPTPESFIGGGILRRVAFRQRVTGQNPAQAYLFIADEDPETGHATSGVGPIICEDVWMEVSDPHINNHVLYPDIFFSDFKVGGRYTNRQGAFLEEDEIGLYYRPSTAQDVVPGNGPASGQQALPAGWLGKIRIAARTFASAGVGPGYESPGYVS